MKSKIAAILFVCIISTNCNKGTSPSQPTEYTFTFDFSEDTEGWNVEFADYPVGEETFYELTFSHSLLPPPLDQNTYSVMISGNNHSDDLFMYLKKKITGLKPDTEYRFTCQVEVASQYPESAMGVGGGPGSSVWLKVGATKIEPARVVSGTWYRMNIDKGNQAGGGQDMNVVGSIGIDGDDFVYTLIQRNNEDQLLVVESDEDGGLWLIVGTDSGFEATTTIYYNIISVNLRETE